jgi:hypothetical protein
VTTLVDDDRPQTDVSRWDNVMFLYPEREESQRADRGLTERERE